jgi:hypothetical protein
MATSHWRNFLAILALAASVGPSATPGNAEGPAQVSGQVVWRSDAGPAADPITGRVFLVVTRNLTTEPRLMGPARDTGTSLYGADVSQFTPGQAVSFAATTAGYPVSTLGDLPDGEYRIQAVLNRYTRFPRSDGHVIWAHMDQWEGQRWPISPGNLVSEPQSLHVTAGRAARFRLELTRVIPPIIVPPDTPWVKRIKIQSPLLTRFWGRPIYLGAVVLLPKGYAENPSTRYPVIYLQGHFRLSAPFDFTETPDPAGYRSWARQREEWTAHHLNVTEPPQNNPSNGALPDVESGYEFAQSWKSADFPRAIAVTFQHPTPFYDDSYAINSANAGPYGDAIMQELIPEVEKQFRTIHSARARWLAGSSTGGWESLALQIYHPDFFGGCWAFCPDPVDFRRYYGAADLYGTESAYSEGNGHYNYPVRNGGPGNRRYGQELKILGAEDGGLEWSNLTPAGPDGYPRPIWNLSTGEIDRSVVNFMREHNEDLREYLQRNWPALGPRLAGKIHVYVGDDDTFYLNLAVYLLQDFLAGASPPSGATFVYGRPLKRHGWMPMTGAELVRQMTSSRP